MYRLVQLMFITALLFLAACSSGAPTAAPTQAPAAAPPPEEELVMLRADSWQWTGFTDPSE